jgi:hypothetical protein
MPRSPKWVFLPGLRLKLYTHVSYRPCPSVQCTLLLSVLSIHIKSIVKGKVVPLRSIQVLLGEIRYSSYSFLTSALERVELYLQYTLLLILLASSINLFCEDC